MTKLSIVMTAYNESHLTQEAILNILNVCKDIDYELLIIDDCSTDDTTDVVASLYSLSGDRIKYYKFEQNQWVTVAWNWWVSLTTWEYIVVINNDVIFPEWFFEKMIDGFKDWIIAVNPRFSEWNPKYPSKVMYFRNMLAWFCYMIKKEDRDRIFPIDERLRIYGNDNWLHHKIKELGGKQVVKHNAICHHLKSQTVFRVPNQDRDMYFHICKEKWWVVEEVYPLPTNELTEDFIF